VGGDALWEILLETEDWILALVFMDLDGTLLDGGIIVKGVTQAIAKLKANKHLPVIATGRIPLFLYNYPETLGIDTIVAANGNFITHRGQIIREKYVPKEIADCLLELSDQYGFDIVVEKRDSYAAYRKNTGLVDAFADTYNIIRPEIDTVLEKRDDILAFVIFDDESVELIRNKIPELEFSRSNRFGYDVNLKHSLKADGVKFLAEYLAYPQTEVYAIGDGYNDIGMLKSVYNSIAMGNAFDEVKAVAKYVTTSVSDNGVQNALKHFQLI